MRRAAFLIILLSISSAQFEDTEGRLSTCQENCCAASGGSWDGDSQDCVISDTGGNAYHNCDSSCLETASRELESGGAGLNPCCAPAFLLLSVIVVMMSRRIM